MRAVKQGEFNSLFPYSDQTRRPIKLRRSFRKMDRVGAAKDTIVDFGRAHAAAIGSGLHF